MNLSQLRNKLYLKMPSEAVKWLYEEPKVSTFKFKYNSHDELISQILTKMKEVVLQNYQDYFVRMTAMVLLEENSAETERKELKEINHIYKFVKENFRYIKDMKNIELIHSPQYIIMKASFIDCDDFSILLSSLLMSIGYTCRFRAVAVKGQKLHHVFIEVLIPKEKKWYSFDAIFKEKELNYVPNYERSMIFNI